MPAIPSAPPIAEITFSLWLVVLTENPKSSFSSLMVACNFIK
ncbi:hypothetical protein GPLA_1824 [Paraglaciecola polaris LMG 21857]|uniref:Uncharacterized protein n=1 Tax=Paraglaciecola polaris LMG 21857 TaxID=1129793 RepID=K6Z9A5_9ALTE|nr:hypothetical protein GPLA_1824 [Paraglaciecola polaris LMG 21857]